METFPLPEPVRTGRSLLLIGIAGASGSGKSCLAEGVAHALDAPLLSLDAYYRDLAQLPIEERARQNFDHPDSIDWPLLLGQLHRLLAGDEVAIPRYDFSSHTRAEGTVTLRAEHVLVVEGILALHRPEIRQLMALKVYVELESQECLRRRMDRDIQERGRTPDCVLRQYQETVLPMFLKYVQPTATLADISVRGDGPLVDTIATVVRAARTLQNTARAS